MSSSGKSNGEGKRFINLIRGWPSASLLPAKAISQAAQAVLADPNIYFPALEYGPDPGYQPLRDSIAKWNTRFYQPNHAITPENITITGGASQNLGVVLQVYTDPGYTRNVWIVAPGYMLVFRTFQDHGFGKKMRAVPEDDEGVDVDFLRAEMTKSEEKARAQGNHEPQFKIQRPYAKCYRHIIYCVPTFSNPSSRTMSLAKREALVKLARDCDALIISDDVYDQLQWSADLSVTTTAPPLTKAYLPRLRDIDASLSGGYDRPNADGFGNTISNGSFSKISGPGMRVGWAEASQKFAYGVSQAGTTCSGGAPSQLTSTYVTELLNSGFIESHIQDTLQVAYASRYRTLVGAVQKHLVPLGVSLPQSERTVVGGFFIWLTLPDDVHASAFEQRCRDEENVAIAPGGMFEVPGDDAMSFDHSVRLCLAFEDEHLLAEGVERMAAVLRGMPRGEVETGVHRSKDYSNVK